MTQKYLVSFAMPVYFTVTVEADNEDEAKEQALEYAELSSFTGNGGWHKLVGVTESCVEIDPGEEILTGKGWEIDVTEIEVY